MSQPFNLPSHLGGSGVGNIPASLQTVVSTASTKNAVSAFNSLDNFAKSMVTVAGMGGFLSIERIMADLMSANLWAVPIKAAFAEMKSELVQSSVGLMKEMFELMKDPQVAASMTAITEYLKYSITSATTLVGAYNDLQIKIPNTMTMTQQMILGISTGMQEAVDEANIMLQAVQQGELSRIEALHYAVLTAIDMILDALGIHIKSLDAYFEEMKAKTESYTASTTANEFGQHTGGR